MPFRKKTRGIVHGRGAGRTANIPIISGWTGVSACRRARRPIPPRKCSPPSRASAPSADSAVNLPTQRFETALSTKENRKTKGKHVQRGSRVQRGPKIVQQDAPTRRQCFQATARRRLQNIEDSRHEKVHATVSRRLGPRKSRTVRKYPAHSSRTKCLGSFFFQ